MDLRKKNGWSQEELAQQLRVSRQSVSKWEGGQSVPDLDKLLALSQIFGVTLDYLVKDEISSEEVQYTATDIPEDDLPHVSVEEADAFLATVQTAARQIAFGVSLCILSPITLLLLGILSETGRSRITEDMAGGLGVAVLLIMVAAAIPLFIKNGMQLDHYKHITQHNFHAEYGVESIAQDRMEKFSGTYTKGIIYGVLIIILGVVPLMLAAGFHASDFIMVVCLCFLLALIAVAVFFLVKNGMIQESYHQILQTGDFAPEKRAQSRRNETIGTIYWCSVTAIYLAVSLAENNWDKSWIIWPVAGVLFAAVLGFAQLLMKERRE
ncbi:helix-turn-helix domain-containing protein [Marvinbryantia formatexigens]|nr:helix-turn-helix transcriptional regulator [Marvinbryantia formatexigens]